MSNNFTWFYFKGILPKKDYEFVDETDDHMSFYKSDEPIVVLEKWHIFHPLTVNTILDRLSLSLEKFKSLIQRCNIQSLNK